MNFQAMLVLGALVGTSLFAPAVSADTYSSVTTTEQAEPTAVVETRSTTVESAPVTVIRERPVVIMQQPATKEVIVIKKKHSHHLINIGPVKVF